MKIHSETIKVCKYFKNEQTCPFERVGCMFGHLEVNSDNEASSEDVVDERCDENQCHICRKILESTDDLWDHVQTEHEQYFNGMLEAAANLSKTNH